MLSVWKLSYTVSGPVARTNSIDDIRHLWQVDLSGEWFGDYVLLVKTLAIGSVQILTPESSPNQSVLLPSCQLASHFLLLYLCQVTLIPTHDTEVTREWYQQTHERQQDLNIMVLASSSTVVMQDESFPACKIEF